MKTFSVKDTGRLILAAALIAGLLGCQSQQPKPDVKQDSGNALKAAETYTRLGIAYMRKGNYETALKKFDAAMQASASYGPAYGYLAVLNERLQQFDEADKNYRKALELTPKDTNIGNFYGTFLCQQERFIEAEDIYKKVIANVFNPTPEKAMVNAGRCARLEPDLEKAEHYFSLAAERNPRFALPLLELAKLSYGRSKLIPARAYIQRYFALAPKSASTLWLALRIERQLGDETEVARYTYLLTSGFPDSPETKALGKAKQNGS